MRILGTLADADVGSTVAFNYYGGSTPGARRRVKVATNDGRMIGGEDVDQGNAYRNFLVNSCRGNVYVLQEAVAVAAPSRQRRVNFVTAREQLRSAVNKLTGEQLANALVELTGARSGMYDTKTGDVVLEMPEQTFVVNGRTVTASEMAKMANQALANS